MDTKDGIHPAPAEFTDDQLVLDPILRFFHYAHLPIILQSVSAPFCDLARTVVGKLPRNAERSVALRKLLEAKDAAVRANVHPAEKTIETPLDRVKGERDAIEYKYNRLRNFRSTPEYFGLDTLDQRLLAEQNAIMGDYLTLLNQRLERRPAPQVSTIDSAFIDGAKLTGGVDTETAIPFKS